MNQPDRRLRVAITKGTLRIPPTYFALSHAEVLGADHDFRAFTLVSEVLDHALQTDVRDFVPRRSGTFRSRELVMPAFMPVMTAALLRYRAQVIHQHFATWSLPAVAAARLARTPLLTTLHGADVYVAGRKPVTAMQRWHHENIRAANAQSRRLLAVSKYLADTAVANGYRGSTMEVHYQGIDATFFTPPEQPPRATADPPIILFVGALVHRKGVLDLARAARILAEKHPHRLVFVGDGPLHAALEAELREHPDARVLGSLNRESVRGWMRQAHLLAVPSQEENGWREAAGLVSLEAEACGTPVVAYASGGISEMVLDGETGLLAAEADLGALTDSLAQVLALPDAEYQAMRARARDFVVTSRSLETSCAELEQHYRDVIG